MTKHATTITLALCISLSSMQVSIAASTPTTKAKVAPKINETVHPTFGETKIFRGQISTDDAAGEKQLLTGSYAQAQETFRQALNKNSKDVAALTGSGFALALQFKLDAADQQFNKALTVNSKDALAHVGKAFVKINRLQSSDMTVIKNRSTILSSAEAECRLALTSEPDMPEALLVLGLVQKEQGKLSAAKDTFTKSIEQDPKYSAAFFNRGMISLKQNDIGAAIPDFEEAIRLKSKNAAAHYGLGVAYTKTNQLDAAYKALNTSLSLNQNSAPAHIAMGDVYNLQGNTNAAIKEYKVAISIKAESEAAYLKLSDIFQNRGDLEIAAGELRSGIELNPNNPDLQLRLADISLQVGKLDDALKGYSTVMNLSPANVAAAQGLTRALVLKAQKEASGAFFVSNNFEGADRLLQRAISMNPNSMELRLAEMKLRILAGKKADLASLGTPTTDPQRLAYAEAALAEYKFAEAQQAMSTVIANCQTPLDTLAVADIALMTRDLDSAEGAYNKADSFNQGDYSKRARRGLDAVSNARAKAKSELTLAQDLASKKQFASGIDKFRSAAYLNPRLADAHVGLAEALQKFSGNNSAALREASLHYKAFVALTPNMPEKEQQKYAKKAEKCIEVAYKIDQGHPPSKLSTMFSPVTALGKKIGNDIKNVIE